MEAETFGPADKILREQMAVMMYRYAQFKGCDVSESAEFSKFTDAASVSGYAKDAMAWAVGAGILTGKDGEQNLIHRVRRHVQSVRSFSRDFWKNMRCNLK